jgi:hypothetical protein
MYEILFQTTTKDRYKLHQVLEDFKEVYELAAANVLYFVVPDRNAILIRSDKPFNGCKEIQIQECGEVDLFVEYCAKGVRKVAPKNVVRTDEEVLESLSKAFEAGGLVDIQLEIKKRYNDNVCMSKGRAGFGIPIAQVSIKGNISDAQKFKALLASGVGKRKSFGCGMVLLFR